MSPPHQKSDKASATARILGSGTSGVLELLGFHPVDTIAKRLMTNSSQIYDPKSWNATRQNLNKVVFKKAADQGVLKKYGSLFPGLGFAAGYKISQRIYKFGGQPAVNDFLNKHYKKDFERIFGDRQAKMWMHATAGSLIGIGEIALLPLDVLKIKMQTNAAQFEKQSFMQIVKSEGWGLYRGASWTAARNAPGSFALFGASAAVKEYGFGLSEFQKATFFENFVASIAGAIASITLSAPLDVIKTRIQSKSADQAQAGWTIVRNMIREEGLSSFFKGLTPKLLVVGPKLIFSFTVAQQLIPLFNEILDKK